MDERQALMAAIIANPDDDTPRLVFADWLQEHGDKHGQARAEFIRLQCELAQQGESNPRTPETRRAAALKSKHMAKWVGPLSKGRTGLKFARGILQDWYVTAAEFAKKLHQEAVCEGFPRVGVYDLLTTGGTKHVEVIANSPAIEWVSAILWLNAKVDNDGLRAFAKSPHTFRLSRFLLTDLRCTDAGLGVFAKSKGFGNLRTLGLRCHSVEAKYTHKGILRILESSNFPRLDSLDILDDVPPPGFRQSEFYGDPTLSRLRVFWSPAMSDARLICGCRHFTQLEELRISSSHITDTHARTLLNNPALANLKKFEINNCNSRQPKLSPAVEDLLLKRFGENLKLEYSPLCKRR